MGRKNLVFGIMDGVGSFLDVVALVDWRTAAATIPRHSPLTSTGVRSTTGFASEGEWVGRLVPLLCFGYLWSGLAFFARSRNLACAAPRGSSLDIAR
jgi:hypothetical protein